MRQLVTGTSLTHTRAGSHRRQVQAMVVLAGRALDVPKQQSTTVANGQQRSLTEVPDLCHRRMASSPTVLPKLAVALVRPRWAAEGTVASGDQHPRRLHLED